jgi:polyhydroxybutyrate depolymerase
MRHRRFRVRWLLSGFLAIAFLGALVALSGWWVLVGRYRLSPVEAGEWTPGAGPGTYRIDLSFDGRERYYLLHTPPPAAGPRPLAIVLHGGGSRPEVMPALTGLLDIANRERFVVVLPAGVEGGWNDGRPDSRQPAGEQNVDDVGFIRAVVEDTSRRVALDRGRVFATGISNGAMMSVRLACDASDLVSMIAPVAGTVAEGFESWCHPERPVAVVAFLGTDDPAVPFEGGELEALFIGRSRGRVVGASAFEAFWSRHNRCGAPVPREELPDLDAADGSRASVERFDACAPGGDVRLYVFDGGGHTWPGGRQYLSPWLVGHTNRDIDASEVMWESFKEQPPR